MFLTAKTTSALPHHQAPLYRLVSHGATDAGVRRPRNEDYYGCFPEIGLFVLADGMGGAAAGDVAARMAVELVYQDVRDAETTAQPGAGPPHQSALPLLVRAIERANYGVYAAASQRRAYQGMGTTIAALLACGEHAALAHVGDSRIYQLRGDHLTQLTEDHSLFADMVRYGLADPDRPTAFQYHHVIMRSLGQKPDVDVDTRLVAVAPGDTFLLCSDGLCGVLGQGEIAEILLAHTDLREAAERLIAGANRRGGPDNVTALLVRWEEASSDGGQYATRRSD